MEPPNQVADNFAAGFGDAAASALVGTTLDIAHERVRARWPGCGYPFAHFAHQLGERLGNCALEDVCADLATLHLEEFYLAQAGVARDASALAYLRGEFGPVVEATLSRAPAGHVACDDIAQVVWMRLLVAHGERPPKLALYRGEGKLANWMRVIAVRTRADLLRKRKPIGEPTDFTSGHWANLGDAAETPELRHLKALYRDRFKTAFATAVAELDPDARNLLRQKHIFGLTVAELAGLYKVHAATIKRRLARARAHLIEATGKRVCSQESGSTQLTSVLRLVRSQLDLSLARYLDLAEQEDAANRPS